MAFRGMEPVRTKIMINGRILEQVSHFNYLGNDTGCHRNYDINVKLGKFQEIYHIFRNKVRRDTKLKFYKVMAVPCLLYTRCV